MAQYGYWQAIPLSFCSRNLYRDVGSNWDSDVVLYLLIILALCWVPYTILVQLSLSKNLPAYVSALAEQTPVIDIKKGIVTTPENQPYIIKTVDRQKIIGIIDTSGQYTTLENQPDNVSYLLTKTEWITRKNNSTIKVTKISPQLNMTINPDVIKEKFLDWVNWLWILAFPILLVGSLIYRLVQALFYAAIGKIYALSTDRDLPYEIVLKLAIVAVTPALVLKTVLSLLNLHTIYLSYLYFAIAIGYLIFAIHANQQQNQKEKK